MDIKTALNRIVGHLDLTTDEMRDVMRDIMTGQCTEAQIGAFMMGMRMKSESIDEIVGAVTVMRELADKVELNTLDGVVDIVGTGGDGANIFNVSTASALVISAAGCTVAKHGNRAVSGKSGSADLLEAAGVYLNLTPVQVARCIDSVGIGFMFAQCHHGAMKHAAIPVVILACAPCSICLARLRIRLVYCIRWSACSTRRCAGLWLKCCSVWAASMCWWCIRRMAWMSSAWQPRPLWRNCIKVKSRNIGSSLKTLASRAKACLAWWSTARSNRWN